MPDPTPRPPKYRLHEASGQTLVQIDGRRIDLGVYRFVPREAVAALRAQRAQRRTSKRTPSELNRPRRADPRRAPEDRYTKAGYEGAITRACRRAGVPAWSPSQLRHSCATRVRRLYGLDGAAAVLGHRLGTVTEVYAEADFGRRG
jgi:integrase